MKTRSDHGGPDLSSVPAHKRDKVETIWNWDFDFVQQRMLKNRLMPEGIIELAITEYRKFMTLMILDNAFEMFSAEVDEVWHAHILLTRRYAEFCQAVRGSFIHHEPEMPPELPPEQERMSRDAFFSRYCELFGEPSILWGARDDAHQPASR